MLPVTFGILKTFFLWPAPSLRGWVRNQSTATPNAVEEPKVVPKPNRPQTCRGAVKEPMRNARTAAGFEPTPSKMPLCEASESLERQQASCPRHAKHKPEKRQAKNGAFATFPHGAEKLLATDPKRPNATTSRARASQKRCVRNPSTRCRHCSFEAVKKNIGKGP